MQETATLVVYSDLDGTLLDHETYSWQPAKPALSRLAQLKVPVILASSKTGQEVRRIQKQMNLDEYPAIVENGAGIVRPFMASTTRQDDYVRLRQSLDQMPVDLRRQFVGFGDMSNEDVARLTNLSYQEAEDARARQFSEPGLWSGTEHQKRAFFSELEKLRIAAREGGRFLTLSFGSSKMDRMAEINSQYSPEMTVALGDAPNDREMLEHADYGFIVANPHRPLLPRMSGELSGHIQRTQLAGPEGWNVAINGFLDRLETTQGDQGIG